MDSCFPLSNLTHRIVFDLAKWQRIVRIWARRSHEQQIEQKAQPRIRTSVQKVWRVRQDAYLCAFLAFGLASSHEKELEYQVQGMLPEAAKGKAQWLYGLERAKFQ